jgi:hypothetical protein
MFLAFNGGLLDAGIAAWECKYVFDFGRPVSLVRHFKAGRTVTAWRGPYLGAGPIQGETWRPYIPTPSFPDQVLTWARFEDAADEAGLSRRYGGIHWQFGDVYARDNGKKTGEGAFALAKKLWEGG